MAWREDLHPGSFRGVAFELDAHDWEGGRRLEVHEFPLRDRPFAEDLGRRARRYNVDAYVIGDDYMAARDALQAALEAEGPGTLIHPYLGSLKVAVVGFRQGERKEEGGMAVFSIGFVEAGENDQPQVRSDTQAAVASQAEAAKSRLQKGLEQIYNLKATAGHVMDDLTRVVGLGAAAFGVVGGVIGMGSRALFDLRNLVTRVASLAGLYARDPRDLALATFEIAGFIRASAETPAAAVDGLTVVAGFGEDFPALIGATPEREQWRVNQAAIVRLVRQAAIVEVVRASADMTFASYDEARALLDQLDALVDQLALAAADAGDDEAFAALTDLRLAMVRDLTARGASLARLSSYTPKATEPAVVIAHRIHGDASREAEIVSRNRLRHPGFVMGGQALQVLIDA